MVPACVIYFFAWSIPFGDWKNDLSQLPAFISFGGNLMPDHKLITGPWWWFSLMMQLYVIYVFVLRKCSKVTLSAVALFFLLFQLLVVYGDQENLSNAKGIVAYLHYNFPYSMLPFLLGIWVARYGTRWVLCPKAALAGLVVVVLGSYSPWLWVVASPFAVVLILQGRNLQLSWLGKISAWLFALHPIVRHYSYYWLNAHQNPYGTIALYMVATVFVGGGIFMAEKMMRGYITNK